MMGEYWWEQGNLAEGNKGEKINGPTVIAYSITFKNANKINKHSQVRI